MTRSVPLLTLLTISFLTFLAWGDTDSPAPPVPAPAASLPWAVEVYREYCPELMDEAHIEDCWTGYDAEEVHIVVVTAMPTLVPSEQDTIPILTAAPPATPPAPLTALPRAVAVYRASCPGVVAEVYVEDCWPGYVGEALHLVVVTDSPDLIPAAIDTIPTLTLAPPTPPTEDRLDTSEADTDDATAGSDNAAADSQGTGSTPSGTSDQEGAASSGSDTQQGTEKTAGTGTETQSSSSITYFFSVDMYGYHDSNTPAN